MSFEITRRELFETLMTTSSTLWVSRYESADLFIKNRLCIDSLCATLKSEMRRHYSKIRNKWNACDRNKERFLKNNSDWLNAVITISLPGNSSIPFQSNRGGRPQKDFGSCSERSKKRKISNICNENYTEVLVYAAQKSLRLDERHKKAKLMKEAIVTMPSPLENINKNCTTSKNIVNITAYTPAEALAFMIEAGLTKNSYQIIRTQAKSRGADLYPSYKRIRQAKIECYPPKESINITETKSEIKLQALLDLTVRRIIQLQSEVLFSRSKNMLNNMHLISKWGCDGSSSHSLYKQVFTDSQQSDGDLFMTCLVPLQLYALSEDDGKKIILWQNQRPSSTRYCRAIKFEFLKETTEIIQMEKIKMDKQINELVASKVEIPGLSHVTVHHDLCMTMIDGKTCNALTNTNSAQKCNMCGATPADMNDIDTVMKRPIERSVCEFGLSTLHAYIRFFEWLYHVSIKLNVKSWQKRKDIKDQINTREAHIKHRFHVEMGLPVGIIIRGKGTTHDGNMARRFFENPTKSADITGISEDLISRCGIILKTLSCGYAVNANAFKDYALDTARLYVNEYSWYPMPASVHKILIHGSDVLSVSLLPIGMLSEEAQESRNKDFRAFREKFTRKISRITTNEDLIHMFLISSDPVISSHRSLPPRKERHLSPEVSILLDTEENQYNNSDDDE